ncbi:MAG: hypothetical protein WA840_13310 [Caulobacteraceae bacterium]
MAETILPFRPPQTALSLWAQPEPVAPPPADVVAAVLVLGDLRVDCEDGKTSIRFSPERVADSDIALLLGADRERALDVTVIWDEAEAEIVRVLDVAPLRAGRAGIRQRNAYAEVRKRDLAPADQAYAPQAVAA